MKLSILTLAVLTTVWIQHSAYAKNVDRRLARMKTGTFLRGRNVMIEKREDNAAPKNPFESLFGTFIEDFTMVSKYFSQAGLTGNIPDKGPSE